MPNSSLFESADLAREIFSRVEVLSAAGRAIGAFATWIGDEAYTPNTGPAPLVSPSRPGVWSGIVIVHGNKPVTWVMLRSGFVVDRPTEPARVTLLEGDQEVELVGPVGARANWR